MFDSSIFNGKVVVVDFWASDCHPCREAVPALNTLVTKLKTKQVMFVGINVDEDPKLTSDFLKEVTPLFPILDDGKHRLISQMGVELMPTTYVLDKSRVVRFINKGFRSGDPEKIEREIAKLIGSRKGGR